MCRPGDAAFVQPVAYSAAPVMPGTAPASLYVGDLDPAVTEAMLFEVFNMVGPVASIRVCRDAVTRRSLGYGYVNYMNVADAERALESLNYTPIRGTPVRIMWSNRDPTIRRSGTGNIFIKNLHTSIDHKALHDTFSAFGNILSCKIAMDGDRSRGYGFVHYETMEMAENAIKHVNGMLLNDQQVYVGLHVSKKERMSKIEEQRAKFTNIYVKNIDGSVDQQAFEDMFAAFGPYTSCVLMVDEEGKSKEFGFVNYEHHEDARRAVEEMHETDINGKQLYVGRAQKKAEREEELRRQYEKIREEKLSKYQGVNLYIKNLDESIDDEKLRQEFSVFGVITSAKVMLDDKTNVSKGFGFVCFSNPDEATKAVTEMNGRMIAGKPIYVALAQRKEVRRAQLAAQMQQRAFRAQQQQQAMMPGGYPAAPIFYPPGAVPPQARGFYPPQAQMMGRPRWAAPGQPPIPGQPGFPQQPGMPQQYPVARGRGAGYKYTPNARNAPGQAGAAPIPNGAAAVPGRPVLNAATLASLPVEQQKRTLGEALFPLVQTHAGQAAGKVTGMLLEMDNGELLHLLESPEALSGKVAEAIAALEEHLRAQQEAQQEA
ncbi:Protein phosphatase PP2A regulatory subunit B [Polyrhizophydium stewartii]|uniref:Polyadenylate-binding protein n=1 Tax=Polyrhizophydium stewartii TaxID=2732419 RepID=A0ABR4NBS1_9FUNG